MRTPAAHLRLMTAALQSGKDIADVTLPPVKRRRGNEEYKIQSAFMRWWRENCVRFGVAECLLFAIPNGSVLGSFKKDREIRGTMLKAAGMRPGVADTMLCVASGKYHGLFMEFKQPSGKLSNYQERFIGYALSHGYRCEVVRSCYEAVRIVEGYLGANIKDDRRRSP